MTLNQEKPTLKNQKDLKKILRVRFYNLLL